ncbi:MAG TPA: site-specific integrase [Acidimicrobiales bacterium]|jgi:integrase
MNRQLRARVLLEEARALGLDVDDLVAAATGEAKPVTVAAWIDEIAPTFGASTAATYRPYWRLAVRLLGDRYLAELTTTDLAAVVDAAAERARTHRPKSNGRASRETCIAALRALFARAVDAGHVTVNPAAALRKPLRTTSRRRALDDRELTDLVDAIRATSSDPDLDLLLIRFHLETGARRQGALNLRVRDIDTNRATVWLREKNDTEREQPASPSLVGLLVAHASDRGGESGDEAVLRNRRGEPISGRRYDRLFARARECHSCADRRR